MHSEKRGRRADRGVQATLQLRRPCSRIGRKTRWNVLRYSRFSVLHYPMWQASSTRGEALRPQLRLFSNNAAVKML
jgi:hypothetical protein